MKNRRKRRYGERNRAKMMGEDEVREMKEGKEGKGREKRMMNDIKERRKEER